MIEQFLSTLWRPVGFGEIRAIDPRRKTVAQRFFDLSENGYGTVVAHVDALLADGGIDVYFGVVPRIRRAGKASDVLPSTDVLWADIDAKHNEAGKAGAWGALSRYWVPPSIVVDSGNGYHAYWLLRDLVPFEEAGLAMKAIARAVGGDHTHDAARVLRVPGTTNYKNADDLLAVRVVRFETRRYRWSDFEYQVDVEIDRSHRELRAHGQVREVDVLPDWLEDLIRNGAPQGQRSEAAFKTCLWLARFGWSDADITATFQNNPGGIGAKYAERRDGDRWLQVTLQAARSRA